MPKSDESPRNHGYGASPEVKGSPTVLGPTTAPCPFCGCASTFFIEVRFKEPPPLLRIPEGHEAVGTYAGCPACPWASPMMTSAQLVQH